MRSILNYEYVNRYFESKGCILLSKQYLGSRYKLDYICANGHENNMTWDNFKQNTNCKHCTKENITLDPNYVELVFSMEGYTLLSAYKSAKQKLDFICPNNHQHSITWDKFRKGQRCGICQASSLSKINNRAFYKIKYMIKDGFDVEITELELQEVADKIQHVYYERPDQYTVDHIIPVDWFKKENLADLEACWSIHNLRYLHLVDNSTRQNRMSKAEWKYMLDNHPDILKHCMFVKYPTRSKWHYSGNYRYPIIEVNQQ